MREKCIATEYGSVYYWLSDTWNDEKETIFFFPGLTADHTLFESQVDYFGEKYNLIAWYAPCHGKLLNTENKVKKSLFFCMVAVCLGGIIKR